MTARWLSPPELAVARSLVPIACVDLLPFRRREGEVEFCLIERNVPGTVSTVGWALVGGRVWHDESLPEAIERHLLASLGDDVTWSSPDPTVPHGAMQYFPDPQGRGQVDPRQHAIALMWAVSIGGCPSPRGEALNASWFRSPPQQDEMIPGHAAALQTVLCGGNFRS